MMGKISILDPDMFIVKANIKSLGSSWSSGSLISEKLVRDALVLLFYSKFEIFESILTYYKAKK